MNTLDKARGNRAYTGVEGLDEILGDGLPSNQLFLLQGKHGTGKDCACFRDWLPLNIARPC